MKAGVLRHRIQLLKPTTTRSATGMVKSSHEPVKTIWGQFSHLSAKDVLTAKAAGTDVQARLTIRYQTGIDHTMQVEHGGQRYEIVGKPLADNRTGREYLTLLLKEVS
ncbi:phage head-tail adaptor, putative, SPP1 family [Moraxella cuniculi DSM 21768]|uniref:Phage head-tail adaptor, putative, SPP1 family n=1 Tax=Moraxella cuniculi DSM 21768 TaxID=1122245 RepID=A0A1N7G4G6_9GAMM|nr:phage head closure protein [Moraxella cuniculi]OOS03264.1 head-tail adaptor protein [Moraxella cuniculi]SIS07438.1 phage head-tail adaptor, putative, SPP1 family [Moraxella cuniculi DSM 21768]